MLELGAASARAHADLGEPDRGPGTGTRSSCSARRRRPRQRCWRPRATAVRCSGPPGTRSWKQRSSIRCAAATRCCSRAPAGWPWTGWWRRCRRRHEVPRSLRDTGDHGNRRSRVAAIFQAPGGGAPMTEHWQAAQPGRRPADAEVDRAAAADAAGQPGRRAAPRAAAAAQCGGPRRPAGYRAAHRGDAERHGAGRDPHHPHRERPGGAAVRILLLRRARVRRSVALLSPAGVVGSPGRRRRRLRRRGQAAPRAPAGTAAAGGEPAAGDPDLRSGCRAAGAGGATLDPGGRPVVRALGAGQAGPGAVPGPRPGPQGRPAPRQCGAAGPLWPDPAHYPAADAGRGPVRGAGVPAERLLHPHLSGVPGHGDAVDSGGAAGPVRGAGRGRHAAGRDGAAVEGASGAAADRVPGAEPPIPPAAATRCWRRATRWNVAASGVPESAAAA